MRRTIAMALALVVLTSGLGTVPDADAWAPPVGQETSWEQVPFEVLRHNSDVTEAGVRRCEKYIFVVFDEDDTARSGMFNPETGWVEGSTSFTTLYSFVEGQGWPTARSLERSFTQDGETFDMGEGKVGWFLYAGRSEGPEDDAQNDLNCDSNIPRAAQGREDQLDGSFQFWLIVGAQNARPVASFVDTPSNTSPYAIDFSSTSTHPTYSIAQMAHEWDFGDGTTSKEKDPTHTYAAAGEYTVRLRVTTPSGRAGVVTRTVEATSPLNVTMSSDEGNHSIGEQVGVSMEVRNTAATPISDLALAGDTGLTFSQDHLELISGPDPALPTVLAPGQAVTLRYMVEPKQSGILEIRGEVDGTLEGAATSASDTTRVTVPPPLSVELSTSVTSETRVGDEFEVVALLKNNDTEQIDGIRAEPLVALPERRVTSVAGPTDSNGNDPRAVPLSIPAGGIATIRWTLRAEERGAVELTANLSGRDPREDSLFFLSESIDVAIEAAEISLGDVRLQPGRIVPGQFGNVRGTITNTGSVDVKEIDFTLDSNPELVVVDGLLDDQAETSPRIANLAPGESREFLIPVAMVIDAGDLASYRFDLTMTGTSLVDSKFVEVTDAATVGDGLDLTPYWSTIIGNVKANLFSDTMEFFEGINDWGDSSTLGGIAVGSSEGALTAFQKMGDGLLATGDLVVDTATGGHRLTDKGKAIVAATREYLHTTTAQKMAVDLANLEENIATGSVAPLAEWMRDVDRAASAGDARKVSALLAEPATTLLTGAGVEMGVEQVAGKLFTRAVESSAGRKVASYLKRAPKPVEEDWIWLPEPDYTPDKLVARELQDLKEMPTGVAISGETAARAGLTADEHAWMIEMSKEHGVAFFVRPRPEIAAKFAKLGYNAKPMAIKLKSISEIDAKWLGWEDMADAEGLVVFRKPKDPLQAMKDAVEAGELEYGGPEIDKIIARYNHRLAEWKSYEKPFGDAGPTLDPREGILHKLNGDKLAPDGSIIPGDGFNIQRYGNTIRTKVTIDAEGVIRFTHNNKPVYSDIDLLAIAKPDGTAIDPELHKLISEKAGFGIDSQHGDSVLTSDFPNWETAQKFAVQYAGEHMRGGDPLVIVQPDVTTLGYVDQITVPEGNVAGSNYDLYGVIQTTYEGAGRL